MYICTYIYIYTYVYTYIRIHIYIYICIGRVLALLVMFKCLLRSIFHSCVVIVVLIVSFALMCFAAAQPFVRSGGTKFTGWSNDIWCSESLSGARKAYIPMCLPLRRNVRKAYLVLGKPIFLVLGKPIFLVLGKPIFLVL